MRTLLSGQVWEIKLHISTASFTLPRTQCHFQPVQSKIYFTLNFLKNAKNTKQQQQRSINDLSAQFWGSQDHDKLNTGDTVQIMTKGLER